MTAEYLAAVEHYCDGLTVAVGCLGVECEYADGDETHQCEANFSWSACDSCGSTLGGDRDTAYGINNGKYRLPIEPIELSICIDCVMFHANGNTP